MRARLRIKTTVMILAWFVTMIHNIIPHSHSEYQTVACLGICHPAEMTDAKEGCQAVEPTHEHRSVCHYQGMVFHHSPDLQVLIPEDLAFLLQLETSESGLTDYSPFIIIQSDKGITFLRAPPKA